MDKEQQGDMPNRQWITVSEAAKRYDYHVDYMRKLASRSYKSDKPALVVDKPHGVYLIWLPSLIEYVDKQRHDRK